jgi:hypothetical protein
VTRQITTVVGAQLVIAAIRYLDTFVKLDGKWFFSERKLMVV